VDRQYRPGLDQVFLAAFGTDTDKRLIVNGTGTPAPLEWKAGARYHIRFINIAPNIPITFTLSSGPDKLTWRAVSKDGMSLPPPQQRVGEAVQLVAVGETYDFEAEVARVEELTLRAVINAIPGIIKEQVVEVPIRVR
jgi:hypothetical protein